MARSERNTPCAVIDCAFAMHGCIMTFTGRYEGLALFTFLFFAVRIRRTPRNGSGLTTWTERERQEGRPPAKKYFDSAYKPALVAHDYACIRRIPSIRPAPDCNQVKMDCFTLYERGLAMPRIPYDECMSYIIFLIFH